MGQRDKGNMQPYLLASMGSHDFQQCDCPNQVVVIVKQWLLYTFTNCFQSRKLYDSIKSAVNKLGKKITPQKTSLLNMEQ